MKIDVLICVHSQTHENDMLLQRALESLTRQTYTNFEIVIVLDECHEDTVEIVRKYRDVLDIRFFERPKKMGLAHAKNFGLSKCEGDWIAYLDADDAWVEDKLEKQVQFILENPQYDVVATQAWDVYDPGEDTERIESNCFDIGQYRTHEQILTRLPHENVLCHASVMLRRELAHYNTQEAFKGKEDWELWNRLANNGAKFYNIPERLYLYSLCTSVPR